MAGTKQGFQAAKRLSEHEVETALLGVPVERRERVSRALYAALRASAQCEVTDALNALLRASSGFYSAGLGRLQTERVHDIMDDVVLEMARVMRDRCGCRWDWGDRFRFSGGR